MRVRPTHSARSHKAQLLVAALVPALIVVLSVTGFVWAQHEVSVVVDGRTLRLTTQASTVGDCLDEAGIRIGSGDVVTPAPDTPMHGVSTVLVRHAVPITLELGGDQVELDIVGTTVADALIAVGADPSASSRVTPSADTPLEPGMTVEVPDVFMRVAQEETTVPAPVRYEKDSTLPKGVKRLVTAGRAGRVLRVYRVLVAGGSEGTPVLTASRTVARPVPRIVAVGTGTGEGVSAASRLAASAIPPTSGRKMTVEATGYSPKQPDLDYTTATGARAERGVVAVDPAVIPLGTRMFIPGYGYAVAADTGGAIDGRRIDLCYDTVEEAFAWGRRTVTIIILD